MIARTKKPTAKFPLSKSLFGKWVRREAERMARGRGRTSESDQSVAIATLRELERGGRRPRAMQPAAVEPTFQTGSKAGLALLALAACVTVNVNFPESAVQQATDNYVKDLYRAKEKGKAPASQTEEPSPKKNTSWNWSLMPEALAVDAADFQFKVETPTTKAIQAGQAERLRDLDEFASGQWGENRSGLLEARISKDFEKKKILIEKVKATIAKENEEREKLYKEILSANKLPSSRLVDIQKKFANSFRDGARPGTWIQSDGGEWSKK